MGTRLGIVPPEAHRLDGADAGGRMDEAGSRAVRRLHLRPRLQRAVALYSGDTGRLWLVRVEANAVPKRRSWPATAIRGWPGDEEAVSSPRQWSLRRDHGQI